MKAEIADRPLQYAREILREGFTFCVTVDANWIVFRPKQVRLLVEHFENKL